MRNSLLVAISMTLLLAGCGTAPAMLDETPQAVVMQPAVDTVGAAGVDSPNSTCDTSMSVQQCCSASGCTGKVLNNKDAHNCKNSGGKSWHPASKDGNPTTCSRM